MKPLSFWLSQNSQRRTSIARRLVGPLEPAEPLGQPQQDRRRLG